MDLNQYLKELEYLVNIDSVIPYYNLSKLLIKDLADNK